MALPKFNEFFPYFMDCLSDGKAHSLHEVRDYCTKAFKLSPEDREIRTKSGSRIVDENIGWARTYLKKAGLITSPQKAIFKLTDEGKKAISRGSKNITLKYLQQYESFRDFFYSSNSGKSSEQKYLSEISSSKMTPTEIVDSAIQQLNLILADDLMNEILKISPFDFETLVVKLLIKMGYGSLQFKNNTTEKSRDEGIDGTVTSDRFGFDTIYIQAKQWKPDSTVGRQDIQRFLGALIGQGATKGVFITTAHFSKGAIEYAGKQLHSKIVLVDGKLLTQLMIEYNLGVTTTSIYEIKQINYAFFSEEK